MAVHLISLHISSLNTYGEHRLSPHMTIGQLKGKLVSITGIPASSQKLALSPSAGSRSSVPLLDDERTLGEVGAEGSTIDVRSRYEPLSAAPAGQYTDVSQVEKFELPEEEYAKRNDTLLAYKQRNKLGRFGSEAGPSTSEAPIPKDLKVDARCQVTPVSGDTSGGNVPRGTVKFVGEVDFGKGGVWVGVEYDEPSGKNDGSVNGKRYFTCRPSHGAFVKPDRVKVGDYPELDPLDMDEM